MRLLDRAQHSYLTRFSRPQRYRALFETIDRNASKRLLEIGVLHGEHARQMIRTASLHHPTSDIHYFGFDLFEDLTPALLQSELSKQASPFDRVKRRLDRTGAHIQLFKGNTKETLPQALPSIGTVDFVFVDGGHSIETIESDWSFVKQTMHSGTAVIFDDYYVDTVPELDGLGCQTLLGQLDRDVYSVEVLEPTDVFKKPWGLLKIKMAIVRKRS